MNPKSPRTAAKTLEKNLRFHLRTYEAANVEKFLRSLKSILAVHQVAPRSAARSAPRLKKLRKILQAAEQLKELSVTTFSEDIWRRSVIECVRDATTQQDQLELKLFTSNDADGDYFGAWLKMMPSLNRFTSLLDEAIQRDSPRRTGRKGADPDFLLTEIAFAYARNLRERPVSTQGGTFYSIAAEVVPLVAGTHDVKRWVLAAIKNYRRVTKLLESRRIS